MEHVQPAPHRHRRQRIRRAALWLLIPLLAGGVWFWNALPEPLFSTPLSPVLFARDGELLGARLAGDRQWRFPLRQAVPARFAQALIRYEDRRFYQHPGVDARAVARALLDNLKQGRVVSGASTLSMQVIRLARGNPPRTWNSKLYESVLALRLELGSSKADILALYAQHAPFGGNIVGVEAAAWRYFGRAAGALSWAEAATLAVLPNSPALVHPGRGRQQLRAKRDHLLRELHADGLLDGLDLRLALAEPLPAAPRPVPRLSPHLLDSLVAGRIASNPMQTERAFVSTLDADLQRAVADLMRGSAEQLQASGVRNAAAIVIDNRDLSILAYLGNSRHDRHDGDGYAMDLVQRPRSSGSVLKPMLYALMLEHGHILPETLVADVPTQINGYVPENFDRSYRGAVPAREALALSLNIPAVRLLRGYGLERFHAELKRMGMHSLTQAPEHYGLTLILGGAETTLWEVAQFYANLAALAQTPQAAPHYRTPSVLIGRAPATLASADYGAGSAWLTLSALAEVNRPGIDSYWRNFSSSRNVAWKTGTSFGLRDAWAVGSTPRYTVAVWAGNASGESVPGLSGTQTAAPLLFAIFNRLPDSGWFEPPTLDLRLVDSCENDGFLLRQGCAAGSQWAPRDSRFDRGSPYHQQIHLDRSGRYRVHADCEAIDRMRPAVWFALPPALEHFYRRQHPDYRPLPPWRADCAATAGEDDAIALIYPQLGGSVYIPAELDGNRSRVVFEAVHRQHDAELHWHLDDRYLGSTRDFHQWEVLAGAGQHRLTLVDHRGNRLSRTFTVLGKHNGI
jgi:penicillin-binding protein 1C